jgi:AcrR family transcriptional regulator
MTNRVDKSGGNDVNNTVIKPIDTPVEAHIESERGHPRRQVTKEQVITVADRLFCDKGFNATSLREVSYAAGYTTGAVYSSFASKADLMLAVADRRETAQKETWREAAESASDVAGLVEALGRAYASMSPDAGWTAAAQEFLAFAYRDGRLREEVAKRHDAWREHYKTLVAPFAPEIGLSPDELALDLAALFNGFGFVSFVAARKVPPSAVTNALSRLFGLNDAPRKKRRGTK